MRLRFAWFHCFGLLIWQPSHKGSQLFPVLVG